MSTDYLKPLDAEAIRPYIVLRMMRNSVTDVFVFALREACLRWGKALNVKFADYLQAWARDWVQENKVKLTRARLMLQYATCRADGGKYIVGVRFSNTVEYNHQSRAYYEFANGEELSFVLNFPDKHITPAAFEEIERQQTAAVHDNETLQHYADSSLLDHEVRLYNDALRQLKVACSGNVTTWPLSKFFRDHQL
jgi:hypothetical protein